MTAAEASNIREVYAQRRARFTAEANRLTEQSRGISHLRAIVFLALIGAGLLVERSATVLPVLLLVGTAAAFVALIAVHRRLRSRESWQRELAALNEAGVYRLERAWQRLAPRKPVRDTSGHPYAEDLDLYGQAGVAQLLGPGGSTPGAAKLDGWLLEASPPAEVRRRQEAAAELAPLLELRERLAVYGLRSRAIPMADVDRFFAWAERAPWFLERRWLRVLTWLLPVATVLLLALHLTGRTGALWLAPVVAAAVLSVRLGGRVHHTFEEAFGREGMFEHFPELIGTAAVVSFDAPLLRELNDRMRSDGRLAEEHLRELRRIMHAADVRLSSMHFILQLTTLWDFHVLVRLERWQRRYGAAVRGWLDAAAEVEALSALGTLAHDHPDWNFAELRETGEPCLTAEALGHPLIADDVRVPNDVTVGPPRTFVLITGSNMSGKSTLLRAIGVNAVLAQAGAPCCARRLQLTPLAVRTSIHIQDSLARGISHFMAELERLKQVVDAADAVRPADAARAGPVTVLYLLDEILHGTNTAERRIAARRVIRHLLDVGAIGGVTTHDLELVDDVVLKSHVQLVHFQETFSDDQRLSFDYRLRPGLATSTNALKLMRYVGLPDA
jgi:hypothetical protein